MLQCIAGAILFTAAYLGAGLLTHSAFPSIWSAIIGGPVVAVVLLVPLLRWASSAPRKS